MKPLTGRGAERVSPFWHIMIRHDEMRLVFLKKEKKTSRIVS